MSVFKEDLLPTPGEIAFYKQNGWLLTNLVFTDEAIDACKAALEEVYSGKYDTVYSWSTDKGNAGFMKIYEDRSKQRLDVFLSLHKNKVRLLVQSKTLAAYAAVLMETKQVRLYRDLLLTMPGSDTIQVNTNWHVDKNFWPTCSSEEITSAWFSLDDCDETSGCMMFASESHKWPRSSFVQKFDVNNEERIKELSAGKPYRIETVPHRKGQVSFHSCLVLHGTLPNRSKQLRQSFAIVFQDETNRYVKEGIKEGREAFNFNTNDRIGPKTADGFPDYHHPEFYPVLFEKEESFAEKK